MDSIFGNGCAWIDGNYVPIEKAGIPITDTGFTRSDLTYDVVAVWNGKFFRLEDHLERFERGWNRIRMRPSLDRAAIRQIVHQCVTKSGLRDVYVEMIMTRGIPVDGDRDPRNFENRFYAFAIPYVWIAKPDQQLQGISLAIANDTRRIPAECVDPTVKNFQWGDLVRGLFEAYDRDAHTAVLLDTAGYVTEGPGFNVFICEAGRLITPPDGVLHGITRATIIELAGERGVACATERFAAERLRNADEIFLTSTAGGVMPVTEIDGEAVGGGAPGQVTMLLRELYWQAHERPEWTEAVRYDAPTPISVGVQA